LNEQLLIDYVTLSRQYASADKETTASQNLVNVLINCTLPKSCAQYFFLTLHLFKRVA